MYDEAYDLILLSFSFKIKKFVCLWAIITYQLGLDFLIPLHIDYSKNYFLPKPQKTHGDNFFLIFFDDTETTRLNVSNRLCKVINFIQTIDLRQLTGSRVYSMNGFF